MGYGYGEGEGYGGGLGLWGEGEESGGVKRDQYAPTSTALSFLVWLPPLLLRSIGERLHRTKLG